MNYKEKYESALSLLRELEDNGVVFRASKNQEKRIYSYKTKEFLRVDYETSLDVSCEDGNTEIKLFSKSCRTNKDGIMEEYPHNQPYKDSLDKLIDVIKEIRE